MNSARNIDVTNNVMIFNPEAAIRYLDPTRDQASPPWIRIAGESEDVAIVGNATNRILLVDGNQATQADNLILSMDPESPAYFGTVLKGLTEWADDPRYQLLLDRLGLAEAAPEVPADDPSDDGPGAGESLDDAPKVLAGGRSDDRLVGGSGDDTLLPRWGEDVVEGGAGADSFIIDSRYVYDGDAHRIEDIDFSEGDTLQFRFFGPRLRIDSLDDLTDATAAGLDLSYTTAGEARLGIADAEGATVSVVLGGVSEAGEGLIPFLDRLGLAEAAPEVPADDPSDDGPGAGESLDDAPKVLAGGRSDDRLVGGSGDDTLLPRWGEDVVEGGAGADSFIIDSRYVYDGDAHRIEDIDFSEGDTLQFRFFGPRLRIDSLDDLTDATAAGLDLSYTTAGEARLGIADAEGATVSVVLGGVSEAGEGLIPF